MPAPDDIRFEPLGPQHLSLMARWMTEAHWRRWWGDPDVELGYIKDMIEGRDTTRPFIFHVGGEATGYIQYWIIGHYQNADWIRDHPWLATLPADAIGVDLSIGPADRLSSGIGSRVLRAFAQDLVRAGHHYIIIDPDPANGRAVRAYEKAGFRPIPELTGRSGDALIMRFEAWQCEG